jgi:class 3 adenylate cyclase
VWGDPDLLVNDACKTPTIAVVGDIRRSQDLMTYGRSPADFSNRMIHFVETTRYSLEKYGALFDKFTGDGFLAYFSETICKAAGTNYLDAFISFLGEYLQFSSEHFKEWTRQVKRLPVEPIGLALGADVGIVSFQKLNQHLFAVGDAIVWAARLASAANANEVLINNLLFERLSSNETLTFQDRSVKTKTGDDILARVLSLRKN